MWPLIALATVAATSGTIVPCVAPIDCAAEVNYTVCDENERFCRDDSSTWSADDGSGNCAWVAEDPEARCPLPGSEAVLGCAGGEEAGDAGCDYELVFEAARAFEKCCDACRYGVCRAPRSKSERKHWSLRGLFKAVALMYAAGLGILACVVCCTFACLRWCDRLTARCERERQREKRRQRREDRRAKRRAKEIEEDLERRAFSFSLDSEGVETEPPPLSRIAEEDLSLDEDSDEEVARRKRSPLSLSPPSPSSRKRSSPKKQTPPRAARSPLRALSAYFGNKRKTRG